MKRGYWILIVLLLLAVGGFFIFRNVQNARAAAAAGLETTPVKRGELLAVIGGTGTVRSNQTALLNWQTTGTVAEVNVAVGDSVVKDQVLANLASSSLPQTVILARADLVSAQKALVQLKESGTARAQAELALVQAQKAFDDADRKRGNLNRARASQETIDVAEAAYVVAQSEVDRLQSAYNIVSGRPEDDPVRAQALGLLSSAKKTRDRALANLNWYKGSSTQKEISEADATLEVARAQLEDAQREWDRLKDGPDPEDIAAAEARIAAIQATLDTAFLKAPFNGTISEVDVKPGDQAVPGTPMFRLDDLSTLLVDVPIAEVDINQVIVGQEVTLSFDAILDKEYKGTVIEVARVGTAAQGAVSFDVTVKLVDADELVRPGMTAAVNIVSSRLEDVLLVPNRAVRLVDNQRVVYLLRNGAPQRVDVTLGSSSDLESQVLSGDLEEGDPIIINPPTEFTGGPGGGGFFSR